VGALIDLNDANPTLAQIEANLSVVGQVATAAAVDAAAETNTLSALVVSKAVAAVDPVSGFAVADGSNTGITTDIPGTTRIRVATDLFAIVAIGAVQAQFGVTVTAYKSATGTATLSLADINGILANRINATPGSASIQELKEWETLLSYIATGLNGNVSSAYASTSDFTQFGSAGAAVQTRNASYPLASIGQLTGGLSSLLGAPPCGSIGTPAVTAVTNSSYSANLSASGTIIVWGTGFSSGGGNSIRLTPSAGILPPLNLGATTGGYFWNLSGDQINASLPSGVPAGQWLVSVTNSCGATSAGFAVNLH
jgi:hypothetical protein